MEIKEAVTVHPREQAVMPRPAAATDFADIARLLETCDLDVRGKGVAQRLVRDRLEWAASEGLAAVYLLTTTAEAYFVKLGFERVV